VSVADLPQQSKPVDQLHHVNRLKSLTLADLLKMKHTAKEPLIAPWLFTGQSAMVWSEPGVGRRGSVSRWPDAGGRRECVWVDSAEAQTGAHY
jgi:hypothetical protein